MSEKFGIGQPLARFEDARLLRGEGCFVADLELPRQAHMVLVRSPHAHARLVAVDGSEARAAPGVLGVFTAEDLARDGLRTTAPTLARRRPDGAPMFWRAHPGLARGKVQHVGDPVAAVVAESATQAKDAAEQVAVEYEPLPASAPVWEDCPDDICCVYELGDRAATEAAFVRAAHVVRRRFRVSRVHAQFLEPRAALGVWDAAEERYTLYCDAQYPHRVREALAAVFALPEHRIRVVCPDVGGAFGAKGWTNVEHRLVLWLARRLGRPVKWVCERSEAPLADEHGRDCTFEIALALDADRRFLALQAEKTDDVGAYVSSDRNLTPGFANLGTLVGVYAIDAAHVRLTVRFSHRNPIAPYRGAGRPEAIYALERLIDEAARELGTDRVELRRKNLVPPSAMPFRNALGLVYDCGEFGRGMERALALADWKGFAARRAEASARGRLRGIGLANAIERAGGPSLETAEVRFDPDGCATILLGTKSQGQGHATMYRQIAAERLGLDPAKVRFAEGDTDAIAYGQGTYGSRSAVIGGSALWLACDKVIAKARRIAAHLLEAAESDLAFERGRFALAGTDRGITLQEVARAAYVPGRLPRGLEPGLFERAAFSPEAETFPNGTHVCEVEVDPETGAVEVVAYTVVDDVGTEINPRTLAGQVVGGVVQGLGQILMEEIAYDADSGQLLSASLMDYALPRASDLCDFRLGHNPVPTKRNPLGAKGAGEAGTVGALAAAMNAIADALGRGELGMPATAERVWRALARR